MFLDLYAIMYILHVGRAIKVYHNEHYAATNPEVIMIKNLIQAYRAKFYDSSSPIWMSKIKNKWLFTIIVLLTLILIISLVISAICYNNLILMCLAVILEFIFAIAIDKYAIKQYHGSLQKEAQHLENVKIFLENECPGHNLYCADKVDILIIRLSEYTQKLRPFKTLTSKLVSFTKSIIFPVITYVAGAYSSNLVQLNLGNTIGYSVAIIAVSAIIYVVWIFISSILRRLIFRDYDIALALYEDLQDIKLIYFTGSCAPTNE